MTAISMENNRPLIIGITVLVITILIIIGYQIFADRDNTNTNTNINTNTNTNAGPTITPTTTVTSTPTSTVSNYPAKDDLIRVTNLMPDDRLTRPFMLQGEARGQWYFEATFPIRLINDRNQTITTTYATAQGEWMTTDYVPFTTTITFNPGTSTSGTLILEKSNPSGLPQNNNELRIPVTF